MRIVQSPKYTNNVHSFIRCHVFEVQYFMLNIHCLKTCEQKLHAEDEMKLFRKNISFSRKNVT